MDSLQESLQALSIQFPAFLIAVIFHEWAHGWMANRYGDSTAKDMGRLTLNPVPHIDVMGTLVFPILMMATSAPILFGWAKPVPINPARFKKYRPGLFWVSFAGAGMNFLLGFLSAAILCALLKWAPQDFYLTSPLLEMMKASISLNFAIGIFNLVPLPPLDGSKMIMSFLGYEATRKYERLEAYSFYILIGLMMLGVFRYLSYPIMILSGTALLLMGKLFGLPLSLG